MNTFLHLVLLLCIIFCNEQQYTKANPLIGKKVRPAKPEEFPFVVSLGHKNHVGCSLNHFCGGSLITKKHILTAAHCIERETHTNIQVSIGSNIVDQGHLYNVNYMITYSQWAAENDLLGDDSEDDVAILKLRKEVEGIILPTLSTSVDTDYYGKKVVAVGWGLFKSKIKNLEIPRYLQTVNMKMMNRVNCENYINEHTKKSKPFPMQWLCANSSPKSILGPGDSGGPLLYDNNIIVAVNSAVCPKDEDAGDICQQNVFISIQYVKDFIDDIIDNYD